MRTTLTLEDDLMAELKKEAHRRGLPLKQVINRVVRLGLSQLGKATPRKRYRCPTFSMGQPTSESYDLNKALSLAAMLEDEETVRKLDLGK